MGGQRKDQAVHAEKPVPSASTDPDGASCLLRSMMTGRVVLRRQRGGGIAGRDNRADLPSVVVGAMLCSLLTPPSRQLEWIWPVHHDNSLSRTILAGPLTCSCLMDDSRCAARVYACSCVTVNRCRRPPAPRVPRAVVQKYGRSQCSSCKGYISVHCTIKTTALYSAESPPLTLPLPWRCTCWDCREVEPAS